MSGVKGIATVLAVTIFAVALLTVSSSLTAAQSSADDAISKKLEEILNIQKEMQDDIAAMKEEIKIIKIRVTQNQ
jgi:hypothetical protein